MIVSDGVVMAKADMGELRHIKMKEAVATTVSFAAIYYVMTQFLGLGELVSSVFAAVAVLTQFLSRKFWEIS